VNNENNIDSLIERVRVLEAENKLLRAEKLFFQTKNRTVSVPDSIKPIFDNAEYTVANYFKGLKVEPDKSKIEIGDQRYLLVRAPSLSRDFFKSIVELYKDRGEKEAIKIGRNLLFDLAHLIGIEDAKNFHQQMDLKDPIEKLSAGPVHFAYTGWAYVEILPESNPVPNEQFFIKYNHPYSFEADSWIKAGVKTDFPVCCMNAGYSSGWCEQSFGMALTAVEIKCRARGDDNCTFIMATPDKINEFLNEEKKKSTENITYDVPLFFERKKSEEKLNQSLKEKEILLKEIHHRVKNNLQIVISLLRLRSDDKQNKDYTELVDEAMARIQSMSLIHEMLYASSDLSKINLNAYCKELLYKVDFAFNTERKQINRIVEIDELFSLDIERMIPLGLMLSEILSNSYKHAFADRKGEISILLEDYKLIIKDNGVGLKHVTDKMRNDSFGFNLINLLGDQLGVKFEINSSAKGTVFQINLKGLSLK
jgi:two-component sensor histidine kinase/predicted hydrocarbon binding protein